MLDLKTLKSALEQLESERGISKEKVVGAIEDALAAAYKKDYGKRGQIIRAEFDISTGKTDFYQIKTVVDEGMVRMEEDEESEEATGTDEKGAGANTKKTAEKKVAEEQKSPQASPDETPEDEVEERKIRFNPEHHILLGDAQKIKKGVKIEEEMIFPLESKDDYGRIAAQTAKQVIVQRIREAERVSVTEEYEKRRGEIVSGTVQRVERGNMYIDLGRVTGVIPFEEQIPGERFRPGDRIQAYLYAVEETARDITLRLSRSHPKFLQKLFEIEVPEIANNTVEIKNIAREPGSRSKIAVVSHDDHIDPVGSCVGQRGIRVATVMNEVGGEKIDIIEWSESQEIFIERSLSPAQVASIALKEEAHQATIMVTADQYSLAIGRGGQNARLAAKLTGWKIDIREATSKENVVENNKDTDNKDSGDEEKDNGDSKKSAKKANPKKQ